MTHQDRSSLLVHDVRFCWRAACYVFFVLAASLCLPMPRAVAHLEGFSGLHVTVTTEMIRLLPLTAKRRQIIRISRAS